MVQSVTADGALEILLRPEQETRLARVYLLATDIMATNEAVGVISETIGDHVVSLRFDRRRITEETTELQAWVYVGDQLLNALLVERGLARENTHPADAGPLVRQLKKAEQLARDQRLGIWSD